MLMKTRYTSYEEVNRELEILKLEREISIRKIRNDIQDIALLFSPSNLIRQGLTSFGSSIKNSKNVKSVILTTVFKFLYNKFFKKK